MSGEHHQAAARMFRYAQWRIAGQEAPDVSETEQALAALPEQQRAVLLAHFTQDGSSRIKARSLGLNRQVFYVLLRASLESLHAVIALRSS